MTTRTVRRLLVVATIAGAAAVLSAGPAVAAGDSADHDCAGSAIRVAATQVPDFGRVVAAGAHLQVVDNAGYANCDQPPRRNP
ncbi:hypothetical protein [Pseudonocardia abyssalis]|uniref:Uncharacterized protein n=1 Tax=Pseudonocardia abyssalis TaxID=2792008 RepID=A0ABS6UQ79_9PSEU|nr:hypothetical protein [Pseudonocardia abyssalis]MBW0119232.1 hypothetical protein [Pseudonocardia abyssalis]MBW0134418.1 hypothetical protein [Pseudonocardia abyssalis]